MEYICLDTSILIEHYRSKNKDATAFFRLSSNYSFKIPAIVKYEILCGNIQKDKYWSNLFDMFEILNFDSYCAEIAANIYDDLKRNNKLIPIDDILIASIAINGKLRLATLNTEHFNRISQLKLVPLL